MTTDPIPDDLRKKAEELVADLDIFPTNSTVTAIAQALMQERERAAKIAMSSRSLPSRDMDAYGSTLAIDIASRIRTP